MEKNIKAFTTDKKERIKTLCDLHKKDYEELKDNELLIKGENLEGLLDRIRMNELGEVLD